MRFFITLIREIARSIFSLFIASLCVFLLIYFSPGGGYDYYSAHSKNSSWNLHYFNWVKKIVVRHDFGKTKGGGEEVLPQILYGIKNSIFLISIALLTSILCTAIFLLLSNRFRQPFLSGIGKFIIYAFSGIPIFIFSYVILKLSHTKLYPYGNEPELFHYLVPGVILGIFEGTLNEMVRHSKEEIIAIKREPYILMAIAKGAKVWKHLKYSLIILISRVISSHLVILISGTVIVEQMFGLPGIGSLTWDSAKNRDTNLLLGILIIVISGVILLNFTNKLIQVVLDPRLRKI
ncbi:MAG: ABC transporter permease [bacterium]